MMNGMEKSDSVIVAMKSANKGTPVPAEPMEPRTGPKGNLESQSTRRTQDRESVSQAADRIRQFVQREPRERLTALLHHVTVDALRWAFFELKRNASAGADGMTWWMYEEGLEGRLADLHDRVHSGAYRATPSRRVNIPKPDGGTRPLGVAAIEDKIVQKAVAEIILTPIYEAEFLGFSYGFRPGRGAHDALDALAVGIKQRKINWVVDCDIRRFFDTVSRDWLVRFLEHRIGDKRIIRLIIKWLNAGVMEDGEWRDDLRGTPQGSVISPILANIYLHYVLDLWFQKKWRSHEVKGDTIIVRYADDFVVGFQYERDAERFLNAVKERFESFELEIHPDKTRLIEFGRFALRDRRQRGQGRPETFDFLGFTHYCTKTRRGRFQLGRKPVAKRMSRTLKRIKEVLRRRMHCESKATARWLGKVLNGWLNYFAVPNSYRYLHRFATRLKRLWLRTLRLRSQKDRSKWDDIARLVAVHWPRLEIRHPWPDQRFAVSSTQGRSRMP
ncbi:MAG: group II intron reverse transcriptase/maturase [Chloroflexi bacterium]|nr:group II intron reverse transcriptase/maturase [Chloroflexota bacterium]